MQKDASAGNRTRAARVAGEHSTTEPPMLVSINASIMELYSCKSPTANKNKEIRRLRKIMDIAGMKTNMFFMAFYILIDILETRILKFCLPKFNV